MTSEKRKSTEKHYLDLGSDTSSAWNFSGALVTQTSFRGVTRGGIAKCRLFSQAALRSKGVTFDVPGREKSKFTVLATLHINLVRVIQGLNK